MRGLGGQFVAWLVLRAALKQFHAQDREMQRVHSKEESAGRNGDAQRSGALRLLQFLQAGDEGGRLDRSSACRVCVGGLCV